MSISKKLIKNCAKQNDNAQKQVFDEYAPLVLAICLRYVKDKDIAEDIMQESFITIFSKIEQYKGIGSFEGWVKKIAVNTNLMYLRSNKNKINTENIEHFLEHEDIIEIAENDFENDSKKEIITKADFESNDILEIMNKMPEGFRTVFNLYAIEGYKHREISKMLNISIGTSKSQLLRSRIKMQELLYEAALEKLKKTD